MNVNWKWFIIGSAIGWFVLPRVHGLVMSKVTK